MIFDAFSTLRIDFFLLVLKFFFATSPVWLPIFLFVIFMEIWIKYIRTQFILKSGSVLLEIRLPRDVFKTPLAMEIIFTSLQQMANSTYIEAFIKGKHRPWFSFELVSIGGEVHFFVWTQPKFRKHIESQFYAQYPGVEISEVEDYTKDFFYEPGKTDLFAVAFKLTKADVYPIKTYVDYGLDREQEEESKIDPMTSVLEYLGSMKAGEQVWIQIMIQAHRKMSFKSDIVWPKRPDWTEAGKKEIKKKIEEINGGDDEDGVRRAPTMGEKETIAALERSLSKIPFEVGIRAMYLGRKESYDGSAISGLMGSFRQYNSETLNGFRPSKVTDFDYPWQNFRGKKLLEMKQKFLNSYKLRSFFQIPYKHYGAKPFILNTEELATIFHLPGKVAGTPTLTKIPSRKSEAPSNLPI